MSISAKDFFPSFRELVISEVKDTERRFEMASLPCKLHGQHQWGKIEPSGLSTSRKCDCGAIKID